jgi:hypothetical protein
MRMRKITLPGNPDGEAGQAGIQRLYPLATIALHGPTATVTKFETPRRHDPPNDYQYPQGVTSS